MMEPTSFYQPSIMHLKFCNGYERKYNIGVSSIANIKRDIAAINEYVEFERTLQGQDDELEDDE